MLNNNTSNNNTFYRECQLSTSVCVCVCAERNGMSALSLYEPCWFTREKTSPACTKTPSTMLCFTNTELPVRDLRRFASPPPAAFSAAQARFILPAETACI